MQTTFALAALFVGAIAQGVYEDISPDSTAPAGCAGTIEGTFEITAVNSTIVTKRDLQKRTCNAPGSLTISLADGVLLDAQKRTGYIADNYQFQFDGPAQTGAIYTAGWSVCSNGSLALGGSAIFYECLSGSFYNLYDRSWAPQCSPILIVALPCSGDSVAVSSVSGATGTTVVPAVTQIGDGQAQAASAIPITQIADGQPQMPSGLVSQIGDGQVQVTTAAAPITQIGDGQPQAPTATPSLSTITSSPLAPITQISDGQPQAPTVLPTVAPAPNATATTPAASSTPSQIISSGNSAFVGSSLAAAIAGLAAVLLL